MNSSRSQSSACSVPKSLALFELNSSIHATPGSLNDDLLVRKTITDAIKASKKSREQIAEEMSYALGMRVTARIITAFTSESKELHRWPGAWDRAFCAAVSDQSLLKCRVEAAGLHVISDAEAELLELGREYLRQKRAAERISLLEKGLQGVDL